jgi:phospholipase C
MTRRLRAVLVLAAALAAPAVASAADPKPATPIKHFVFLMQENHTFDNYFGAYPGADGRPANVCQPIDVNDPAKGCVKPEHLGSKAVLDLGHSRAVFQAQYRNGRMDGFVDAYARTGEKGTLPVGYYDDRDIPYYYNVADNYVLFDRFFSSAHAGSGVNHVFWVTATPGNADSESLPKDGFKDLPTIFDRLEAAGVSWKFYVQNYDPTNTFRNPAKGDRASQTVWVPLLAYPRYLDDPKLFSHIQDLGQYYRDAQAGTLPAVAFIAPAGSSEHPPGRIQAGQTFVRTILTEMMRSPEWPTSAFMWSYDDWGGWYDHVKPPQIDAAGYGFRVPTLLVSPYARKGFVDHVTMDYTSALKFIEENWGVAPLADRDRRANSIASAFDFTQAPRPPVLLDLSRTPAQHQSVRTSIVYQSYGAALVSPLLIVALGGCALLFRRRRTRRRDAT